MNVRRTTAHVDSCRPRVEGERESQILDATIELLLEVGYDRLTMDAVASRAKASKATLYRRWVTKAALVVDAVIRSKRAPNPADVDTGSLRGDLVAAFCGPQGLDTENNVRIVAAVVTALHTDPEFAADFRARFLAPKLIVTQAIYRRAADRGELLDTVDPDLFGPALAGILLHRYFVVGQQIDQALVEQVVDHIIVPAATGRPYSQIEASR